MADNLIKVYDNVIDEVSCKMLIEKFEDSHANFKTVHQEDGDERISFEQIILAVSYTHLTLPTILLV